MNDVRVKAVRDTLGEDRAARRGGRSIGERVSLMTALLPACFLALTACGGGGGDAPPPPPPATYSVGGTVSGLSGAGLVLQLNGGNDLVVQGNGNFAFSSALASAAGYVVTVRTQPTIPTQVCTVNNGSGSIGQSNVANVSVSCAAVAPKATLPLSVGKRWLYDVEIARSVSSATGVSRYSFSGERFLHVEEDVLWAGRSAWKIVEYDLMTDRSSADDLEISTTYLAQDANGLERWFNVAPQGEWRRVLSSRSVSFSNGGFLLMYGPTKGNQETKQSIQAITVPAGTYNSVRANYEFAETGQFAPVDIFESRSEYYADGIGPIGATWDYLKDDNDPRGIDETDRGSARLKSIDAGYSVVMEQEPNDNGVANAAQQITIKTIAKGRTHINDAGVVSTNANVSPNKLNVKRLQDWYRFERTASSDLYIRLKYNVRYFSGVPEDLDLYLFKDVGGTLTFVGKSTRDPMQDDSGEVIKLELTASLGNYYIAVQAWNTPSDAVPYALALR